MIDQSNFTAAPTIAAVDDRYGQTVQEYVEVIRDLLDEQKVARVKDIAERRRVTRSSVSTALNNLRDLGLIEHENYGYITLTAAGEALGAALARRHYVLSCFLRDILGLPPGRADDEACRLEHTMSAEALNALVRFVHSIHQCPNCKEFSERLKGAAGVNSSSEGCPCFMVDVHRRLNQH